MFEEFKKKSKEEQKEIVTDLLFKGLGITTLLAVGYSRGFKDGAEAGIRGCLQTLIERSDKRRELEKNK